jgi:single-strand DNA-binding protein
MLNKVLLIGHVGKDAELRATPSGTQVLTFSLATSKSWTSNGEKKEKTEWHNIVCYGKTAATIQKWVTKGRKLWIEGEIQGRSWDDKKTGEKKYSTHIHADNIQFLDKSKEAPQVELPQIPTFDSPNLSSFASMDDIPF